MQNLFKMPLTKNDLFEFAQIGWAICFFGQKYVVCNVLEKVASLLSVKFFCTILAGLLTTS